MCPRMDFLDLQQLDRVPNGCIAGSFRMVDEFTTAKIYKNRESDERSMRPCIIVDVVVVSTQRSRHSTFYLASIHCTHS